MTIENEKGYEIAEKYLRKKYGDDYVDFLETEGQSYLDGLTEGRKETCETLEKENAELIQDTTKRSLIKENTELKEQIADLQKYIETLSENYENEIAEHKKVIEKMKCCANCKFEYAQVVCVSPSKCKDMDKWELIE